MGGMLSHGLSSAQGRGQFVCILLNLEPVSSWVHSSQFCRATHHLMWGPFCFIWYKSKCRETSGFLLFQNSFGGVEVYGLQSRVPCCSVWGVSCRL